MAAGSCASDREHDACALYAELALRVFPDRVADVSATSPHLNLRVRLMACADSAEPTVERWYTCVAASTASRMKSSSSPVLDERIIESLFFELVLGEPEATLDVLPPRLLRQVRGATHGVVWRPGACACAAVIDAHRCTRSYRRFDLREQSRSEVQTRARLIERALA
ncbi:MAG TPA: hypothetical protein VNO30_35070 [Kofleriaceae bacterium]|nr:hypothetical protein [Kofleriaceae bacterium]